MNRALKFFIPPKVIFFPIVPVAGSDVQHKMPSRAVLYQFCLLFLCCFVTLSQSYNKDLAKSFLREQLELVNQRYPFEQWKGVLLAGKNRYTDLSQLAASPDWGLKSSQFNSITALEEQIEAIKKLEPRIKSLMEELSSVSVAKSVQARFLENQLDFSDRDRIALEKSLLPFEDGSLSDKKVYLFRLGLLENEFNDLKADWLYKYASNFLAFRVNEILDKNLFTKSQAQFEEFRGRLSSAASLREIDPPSSEKQLQTLQKDFRKIQKEMNSQWKNFLELLNTDMLFSDLLTQASHDKVEFTIEVEEKIEASLKERSDRQIEPIKAVLAELQAFPESIKQQQALAHNQSKEQKSLAEVRQKEQKQKELEEKKRLQIIAEAEKQGQLEAARAEEKRLQAQLTLEKQQREADMRRLSEDARAQKEKELQEKQRVAALQRQEEEKHRQAEARRMQAEREEEIRLSQIRAAEEERRREDARIAAFKAEEERLARERKEKMQQTLSMLTSFSFKSEIELNQETEDALKQKAGFLKTTHVASAQQKLSVSKAKFTEQAYRTEPLVVTAHNLKISALDNMEKSSYSVYAYRAPSGRTTTQDLRNFVMEISLASFDNKVNFISYAAPNQWRPGSVSWQREQNKSKKNLDRELSYVELVVDAHRVKKGGSNADNQYSNINVPANMFVVFDPRGAIIRYQSFNSVSQVRVESGDLVDGNLHYKFLNYSVDNQNIYLNGIDREIKSSSAG